MYTKGIFEHLESTDSFLNSFTSTTLDGKVKENANSSACCRTWINGDCAYDKFKRPRFFFGTSYTKYCHRIRMRLVVSLKLILSF